MAGTGIVALLVIAPATFALAQGNSFDPRTNPSESVLVAAPAAAVSIPVSARVQAVRLIVINEKGIITSIWSNTPSADPAAFVLRARQGGLTGQDVPMTGPIRAQYERLATHVDWSVLGKAYSKGS